MLPDLLRHVVITKCLFSSALSQVQLEMLKNEFKLIQDCSQGRAISKVKKTRMSSSWLSDVIQHVVHRRDKEEPSRNPASSNLSSFKPRESGCSTRLLRVKWSRQHWLSFPEKGRQHVGKLSWKLTMKLPIVFLSWGEQHPFPVTTQWL